MKRASLVAAAVAVVVLTTIVASSTLPLPKFRAPDFRAPSRVDTMTLVTTRREIAALRDEVRALSTLVRGEQAADADAAPRREASTVFPPTPPPTPTPTTAPGATWPKSRFKLGSSHAQFGQDEWVHRRYDGRIPPTFVEFGCRDGVKHSNTHALEAAGWKGLCVEAIEKVRPVRKRAYQGAICAPEAAGENVTFTKSALPGLHGVKGTTDLSFYEPRARITKDVVVKCLSLPALLDENNMTHVGYMTVDVEGGEIAFAKHFDFYAYRVDVLQVECRGREVCQETRDVVEALGLFRFVHRFEMGMESGDLLFENVRL